MLIVEHETCLTCAGCVALCPESALLVGLTALMVSQESCNYCGICVKFCPVTALVVRRDKNDYGRAV